MRFKSSIGVTIRKRGLFETNECNTMIQYRAADVLSLRRCTEMKLLRVIAVNAKAAGELST